VSAAGDLEFLRKFQRLLAEGEFVATYKFALLQALADLSVEQALSPDRDKGLTLPLSRIADKFIEYYWRQAIPYAPGLDQAGILKQNTGRQAAVINSIVAMRDQYSGSIYLARRNMLDWRRLVRSVITLIKTMPLWKLQVIGRSVDDFIYRQGQLENGCIQLRPGVHSAFRSFHGLITNLIQGGWLTQVRRISGNHDLLGERGDLAEFLFGSERRSLDGYRKVMRDYQSARCFYCEKPVRGDGNADHFIPWSRYPVDLGHNFVFSHPGCNNAKSDLLAHPDHLARWRECNLDAASVLGDAFDSNGLVHDAQRSRFVAAWAYEQGEQSKAHTWLRGNDYPTLDGSWRDAMGELRAVAETPADYEEADEKHMYETIQAADQIALAQAAFEARVREAASRSSSMQLGYQGGGRKTMVYSIGALRFWVAFADSGNRYWNALGIGNPFKEDKTIIAEINPPKAGINRRVSGAFIEDSVGRVYLAHRGRVGGGRKGIGKKAFMAWYPEAKNVVNDDGRNNEMIIIGRLDDNKLIENLAAFTYSVARFKDEAAPGT